MAKMKGLYLLFDTFLAGIFGLTIIDLMVIIDLDTYGGIDDVIKTLLACAGLFYLIFVKIPNELKMNKLNRESKKLENESKKMANKDFKDTHTN